MTKEELEQENAELKAVERMALYSKMSDQLTKAKEIIAMQKRALENYILSPDEIIKALIRKAEALLKG
jgi:hypothetical protein